MASYKQIVDFLPDGSEIIVHVELPKVLTSEQERLLNSGYIKEFPYSRKGYGVALFLKAPLRISFSISNTWKISKDLEPCICTTPVLPNKELESINSAYEEISILIETDRRSHGGIVYKNIFFKSDEGDWRLLDKRRDEVYEPYRKDYEEKIDIYKSRTIPYLKPHPASDEITKFMLEQKDEIIQALQTENQDQLGQIKKLNELFKQSKLCVYKDKIRELEERLRKEQDYLETSGGDSWQTWIYTNNWLFANSYYAKPLPKEKVGFHNVPDFLFPTLDGFIDVLEIKRPSFEIIEEDKSHYGSYKWSRETNEAIGQVVNYLYEIELHQLEIQKNFEDRNGIRLSAVKPRGVILIGKSDQWKPKKHEALRRLNHSLHSIEVITYTDLLYRGKNIIAMYDDSGFDSLA